MVSWVLDRGTVVSWVLDRGTLVSWVLDRGTVVSWVLDRGTVCNGPGVVQRRDRQKKEFHDQSDYR